MISKIDLVTRVIQNEFQFYIGKEQLILEFLLKTGTCLTAIILFLQLMRVADSIGNCISVL